MPTIARLLAAPLDAAMAEMREKARGIAEIYRVRIEVTVIDDLGMRQTAFIDRRKLPNDNI